MMDTQITEKNWPHISKESLDDIIYDVIIDGHSGDIMGKEYWLNGVGDGMFIDYDGYGDLVDKDGKLGGRMRPSSAINWPDYATHILWYNR